MQLDQSASAAEDRSLRAHEINDIIILMVEAAMRLATNCLDSGAIAEAEAKMLSLHVDMLRSHSAAIEIVRSQYEDPTLDATETREYGSSQDDRSGPATVMLRPFIQSPDPTDGKMIAAIDRDVYDEDVAQLSNAMASFWAQCNRRISRPNVEFFKAGAKMWDHLGIDVPAHWVTFALSLKAADVEMVRAAQAAIFSTVATTVGPVCIDSLYQMLGTFIHTHPAFREIVQEGEWQLPYGDRTAYRVVRAPTRRAEELDAAKGVAADSSDPSMEDRLLRVDEREVSDALEFETELRKMFGLHFIDGELDSALLPAMEVVVEKTDAATKQGLAIAALHKFIHNHPRGFGRYFEGSDRPYPRPSKEVQAEIDAKLPTYIAHLKDELADAIEEEKENSLPDGTAT